MNQHEERIRASRLTAWSVGVSAAVFGGAFALLAVAPAGAEGVRTFLGWCGIG